MAPNTAQNSTREQVVGWRRDQLVASGFKFRVATRIAKDSRYDIHALIELVERGCGPDLAVRILAPLEDEVAA